MGSIAGEKRPVNIQGVFVEAMAEAEVAVVKEFERWVTEKLTASIDIHKAHSPNQAHSNRERFVDR